jgi:uncharacterized membrane protein
VAARKGPVGLAERIGGRIAPPRFLVFIALVIIVAVIGMPSLGWREGTMVSFDIASIVFLGLCTPLLRSKTDGIRATAKRNDANRGLLLVITGIVSLAVLVAVAAELTQDGKPPPFTIALVIVTLALSWIFSNFIYALHYAHLFYKSGDDDGADCAGITFPGTDEPDYWDFIYFAFCLGMTFQTSDVTIEARHIRRVVTFHCLAAFVFNLGIIAFSINVLGG